MKTPTLAPTYACIYPGLAEIAQKHGYALAIHGSLQSDLDLVAIPWTDKAVDAETLINALMVVAAAYLPKGRPDRDPEQKPHGRLAWSLHLEAGAYIDLSVMPRCDHDWEEVDDSFDHEFGTEQIHFHRCSKCDATRPRTE